MQRSALCRSRRELSNENLLAKIGVDTAENEPLEVRGKIQFIIHSPSIILLDLLFNVRLGLDRDGTIWLWDIGFRPGTKALREIKKLQKTTVHLDRNKTFPWRIATFS